MSSTDTHRRRADDMPPETREESRLEALARYEILGGGAGNALDSVTEIAARMFAVPLAVVAVVDAESIRWFSTAPAGTTLPSLDAEGSFFDHAMRATDVSVVPDIVTDGRFVAPDLLVGGFPAAFIAGAPIRAPGGQLLGALCLLDIEPRFDFRADSREDLANLARLAVAVLDGRIASGTLAAHSKRAQLVAGSKAAVMSRLSHELRTPLNAIIGFSELLETTDKAGLDADRVRDYSRYIASSGHDLLALVDDLMNFAHADVRPNLLRDEAVDLGLLATHVARTAPGREQARADIAVTFAENLPLLRGDFQAINHIVTELVANAVRFGRHYGGIEVSIAVDRRDRLVLEVADRGPGMTEDEVELALEPLVQIADVYSRQHEGIGLGLAKAKTLAERHGAHFTIHSERDVGTNVVVAFPASRTLSNPAASPRRRKADSAGANAHA